MHHSNQFCFIQKELALYAPLQNCDWRPPEHKMAFLIPTKTSAIHYITFQLLRQLNQFSEMSNESQNKHFTQEISPEVVRHWTGLQYKLEYYPNARVRYAAIYLKSWKFTGPFLGS